LKFHYFHKWEYDYIQSKCKLPDRNTYIDIPLNIRTCKVCGIKQRQIALGDKWRDVSPDFGLDPKSILRKKKLERILNES